MRELRHLLIRGVNWLGDAVLTLPALQRLREAHPHNRITLLTHEKLAGLWRGHPILDRVLTFAPGESPRAIGRRLRDRDIDTALILPNSPPPPSRPGTPASPAASATPPSGAASF